MIGHDCASGPLAAWRGLAAWLAEVQLRRIEDACRRILSRVGLPEDAPVVAAGVGRFVAPELARRLGRPALEFARLLPDGKAGAARVSDCAPAVAVAWLAQRD
jgi:uncharacterized hydantoinase/oxoprolinase family protein